MRGHADESVSVAFQWRGGMARNKQVLDSSISMQIDNICLHRLLSGLAGGAPKVNRRTQVRGKTCAQKCKDEGTRFDNQCSPVRFGSVSGAAGHSGIGDME